MVIVRFTIICRNYFDKLYILVKPTAKIHELEVGHACAYCFLGCELFPPNFFQRRLHFRIMHPKFLIINQINSILGNFDVVIQFTENSPKIVEYCKIERFFIFCPMRTLSRTDNLNRTNNFNSFLIPHTLTFDYAV